MFLSRLNSVAPNAASTWRIERVMAGVDTKKRSAAFENDPSSLTAISCCSSSKFSIGHLFIRLC